MKGRELIEQYIDANPHGRGPAEARLSDYGVQVWALVEYWQKVAERDIARVANDYDLPEEAVRAALAYYRQNKKLIDARILVNAA